MSHVLVDWVWLTWISSVSLSALPCLGLMGIWQKRLGSWASWWKTEIKVNPTQVYEDMGRPIIHLQKANSFIITFSLFSLDYNENSSTDDSEYEPAAHYRYREKRVKKNDNSEDDITPPPSPPRYTSSGRLIQKTQK